MAGDVRLKTQISDRVSLTPGLQPSGKRPFIDRGKPFQRFSCGQILAGCPETVETVIHDQEGRLPTGLKKVV